MFENDPYFLDKLESAAYFTKKIFPSDTYVILGGYTHGRK